MFYLVTQITAKGLAAAEKKAHDDVYGTRKKAYFNAKIFNRVSQVTSEVFESPTKIKEWFIKHRANFSGGTSSQWDSWLYGEDSSETVLNQNEEYRFFFMECEEFNELDKKQRVETGI